MSPGFKNWSYLSGRLVSSADPILGGRSGRALGTVMTEGLGGWGANEIDRAPEKTL